MAQQASPVDGQDPLDFDVTCPQCTNENGGHAYWCPVRKRYAKDRQQGS